MPARIEPILAARSRNGARCARWLRLGAFVLAACSLTVACFLNPKTDDLPGSTATGPGVIVPGGDSTNEPDDGEALIPSDPGAPPNLGGAPPATEAPDAGSEPSDTGPADAGADPPFPLSHDGGLDAE